MKSWRTILVGFLIGLLPVCGLSQPLAPGSASSSPSTLGNLRVSLLDGDVQIKSVDLGDWAPASINLPLMEKDELWVPEAGRLEVQVLPATYVRLDQHSSLAVITVTKGAEQLYMAQGLAYINFNPARGGMVQVDTPVSSIQVYQKAVFRVDVTEQGLTDVSVLDGTVYVESQGGKTTVNAGQLLSLREGTDAEMSPLGPPDDWENWNVERDKRVFVARDSGRHLPPDLRGYASDLDNHGRWVYVKEYGQVWTPTVVVSAGWSPYRVGRWTWIGRDYVWVSYEPWGWAPYHYGRWAHTAGIGWCWVPPAVGAVYWAPGYVGWVSTPNYVAWVPLAPREVYYGYGYFGPHSVNLYTTNMNSIRVTNIYRNVHIHNSVTVVNHSTFVRGYGWGGRLPDSPLRYTDTGFRGNPFLENRIHVGRPLIQAERSTMISVHREIASARLPPSRVREVNVTTIRETRRVVSNPGASAFTPTLGPAPRSLTVKQREGVDRTRSLEPRRVVGPGGEARVGAPGLESVKKTPGPESTKKAPGPEGVRKVAGPERAPGSGAVGKVPGPESTKKTAGPEDVRKTARPESSPGPGGARKAPGPEGVTGPGGVRKAPGPESKTGSGGMGKMSGPEGAAGHGGVRKVPGPESKAGSGGVKKVPGPEGATGPGGGPPPR